MNFSSDDKWYSVSQSSGSDSLHPTSTLLVSTDGLHYEQAGDLPAGTEIVVRS